jgi:hypothetical protein
MLLKNGNINYIPDKVRKMGAGGVAQVLVLPV